MQHKCHSCVNFTDYYIMQSNRFAMVGCGDCKLKKQCISRHSTCAAFEEKLTPPRKANLNALTEKLEEVVTELNAIKLILDEREKD